MCGIAKKGVRTERGKIRIDGHTFERAKRRLVRDIME